MTSLRRCAKVCDDLFRRQTDFTQEGRAIWLITDEGFISIVKFDPKYDQVPRSRREKKRWGSNPLLVRARVKDDLEQIRPYYSKLKIEADTAADYKYRAVVPGPRMADFISTKMVNIDYSSHVKEIVRDRSPKVPERYSVMLSIWSALAKLQDTSPYSGAKWYTGGKSGGSSWNSLCAGYVEYTENGSKKRQWCDLDSGHKGACKFPTDTPKGSVKMLGNGETTTPDLSDLIEGMDEFLPPNKDVSQWDYDDIALAPETVLAMGKALLIKSPQDIYTDEGTPAPAYNLWAKATEDFNTPLTHEDLVKILYSLVDDETVESAFNEYIDALDEFSASTSYVRLETTTG